MDFYEKPEDQIWLKYPQLIEFWVDYPDMTSSGIDLAKFENTTSLKSDYKEIWEFLILYSSLTKKIVFEIPSKELSNEDFDVIINSFEKWQSQKVTKAALESIKKECIDLSKTKVLPQVSSEIVIGSPGYRPYIHYHHRVMQIVRYIISAYSGMFLESKVINSVIFQFLIIQKDFKVKPTSPDVIQLEFYEKPEEQIWLKYPQLIEFWADHAEISLDSAREDFLKLVAKDLEPLGKEIKDEILKDSLNKWKTQEVEKRILDCIKSEIVSLVELNKTSLRYFTPEGVRKITKRLNDKSYQVDRDVSPTCLASIISEVEHITFKIVVSDDQIKIKTEILNSVIFQLSVALKKIEDEETANVNINNANNNINNNNNNMIASPTLLESKSIQIESYEKPEDQFWLENPKLIEFWVKYPNTTQDDLENRSSKLYRVFSRDLYNNISKDDWMKNPMSLRKCEEKSFEKWQTQKVDKQLFDIIKTEVFDYMRRGHWDKNYIMNTITLVDGMISGISRTLSISEILKNINNRSQTIIDIDKVDVKIFNCILFQLLAFKDQDKIKMVFSPALVNINNNNNNNNNNNVEPSIQIESYKKPEDQVWLENPSHIEFWADYPDITLTELSNLNSEPLSKYHQLVRKEWLKNRISLREMRDLSRQKWQTQKVSKQLLDIIKIETKKYVRIFQVFYDWHADNLLERVTLHDDGFIYDVNETFSMKSIIRNIREHPGFETISDDLFNKIDVKIFNSILFQLLVCKKQDKLKHSITGSNSNNNNNINNNINTDVNDNNIVPSFEIEFYEKSEEQQWLDNPQLIEFWADYPNIVLETWHKEKIMETKNKILARNFLETWKDAGNLPSPIIEPIALYAMMTNSLKKWETQRVSKEFLDVVKIEVEKYAGNHLSIVLIKTREDVRKCVSLQGTTCNIIDKEYGLFQIYMILAKIREYSAFATSSSETKVDIFRFNSILFQLLVLQKKMENNRAKPSESAMSMLTRFLGPPQGPITRSLFSSSSPENPMYVLDKKDLETVMSQAEISKEKATELLVKNKGNVVNSIMEGIYKDSNIPANNNNNDRFDLACPGCVERGRESACGLRKTRLEELSKEKGKRRLSEMISQLDTFTRNENNNNNNNQDEEMSSDSSVSDDEFPELVPYNDEAIEKVVEHANTDRTKAIEMLNKHKGNVTSSIIEIVENNSRNDNNNNNNNNIVPSSPSRRNQQTSISASMESDVWTTNHSILGQSLGKAKYGDSYRNIPEISWTSGWKIAKVSSSTNATMPEVVEMLKKHRGNCEKAIDEIRLSGLRGNANSLFRFFGSLPTVSTPIISNNSAMFIVDDTVLPSPSSKEDNKKRGYPFIDYENPIPIVETDKKANENNSSNNDNNSSKSSSSEEDYSKLCVICIDKPREIVLIPCGHMCYCVDCSELIDKRAKYEAPKDKNCPLCRKTITMKTKIYF